jgi:hypothetical protein
MGGGKHDADSGSSGSNGRDNRYKNQGGSGSRFNARQRAGANAKSRVLLFQALIAHLVGVPKNANKRRIKNTVAQVGYNKPWIPVLGSGIFSLISFTVPKQTQFSLISFTVPKQKSIYAGWWFRVFFSYGLFTILQYLHILGFGIFSLISLTALGLPTCSCRHAILVHGAGIFS